MTARDPSIQLSRRVACFNPRAAITAAALKNDKPMIKNTCHGRGARRSVFGVSLVGAIMLLLGINPKAGGFEQAKPQETAPPVALAHFHHLHLNATDPAAAIFICSAKTRYRPANGTRNTSARSVEAGAVNRGSTATSQSDQARR